METNIFDSNPVQIWLHSKDKKDQEWSYKVFVILGQRSGEVKKEIHRKYVEFKAGKLRESKILTAEFGPKWKSSLAFYATRGGDAIDNDGAMELIDRNLADDQSEPFQVGDVHSSPGKSETKVPGPEPLVEEAVSETTELDGVTNLTSEYIISAEDLQIDLKEPVLTKNVNAKDSHVFVYDMAIYPEDKVSDVKYKIARFFDIPIFRQHMWYRKSNQSYPLSYRLSQSASSVIVDMHTIIANEKSEIILGIPVNMFLYKNKDTLKVEAYDNFTLMGNLYLKTGTNIMHLVDLENWIAPVRSQLSALTKEDKYQIAIIYYSFILKYFPMLNMAAWEEYIEEKSLKNSYPQLEPSRDELRYLDRQQDIMDELYELYGDHYRVDRINSILQKSLTDTTLKVLSSYRGKIINQRILFDMWECDADVDAVRLYDIHEGHHIQLDKYYNGAKKSQEKLIPGVFYMRIVVSRQPYQKLNLYIYPNGSYAIKGVWGEDLMYGFKDVNRVMALHVTPVIEQINKLGSKVMYFHDSKLPKIDKSNVKYVDISISLFWKKILNLDEFSQLKGVLDKMISARIIQEKLIDKNVLSYFFKKGMYQLDPTRIEKISAIDNYYSYLFNSDIRQKWYLLFENIRVLNVTHRFSDVKLEISGIKEDEYYIFIRFITLLFSKYMVARKGVGESEERKITKPLSNLKEQDPHLYNFKKLYNSQIVYSKICQKPYQPLLLSQTQFDKLDKKTKEAVVRYWNFTTNSPAYYRCPNPKFPYIRFITGKHPLGYCIPCCKITQPSQGENDRQRVIYDTCLNDHKFERKQIEQSSSRYIMSYGKPIDIGRLSHLPETTMESLFYDTKIDEEADDSKKDVISAKYYLYGVPQNHPQVPKVGYLYSLATAMNLNVDELINLTIKKMREFPQFFNMFLQGEIVYHFESLDVLIAAITDIFINKGLATDFPKWNELWVDIARLYHKIYTVVFEDKDTVIQLDVPRYMSSATDFQYPQHEHLIVLHNLATNYWNPVFVIHKDLYFRAGIIDKKTFAYQSDLVQLINDMVKQKYQTNVQSDRISYSVMKLFLESTKKYTLGQMLMTKDNLCYGLLINEIGYVPIHLSYVRFQSQAISFSTKDLKPAKLADVVAFQRAFNTWVAHESEKAGFTKIDVPISRPLLERVEPIYPFFGVDRWLALNGKCVAFVTNGLNWYIQPVLVANARKEYAVPVQEISYDPLEVNELLEKYPNVNNKKDRRQTLVHKSMYKHYLYQLLVLEFIQIFNKQRNVTVRTALKKLFMKTDFKKSLRDLPSEMQAIIFKGFDPSSPLLAADVEKLKVQITEFVNNSSNKKLLLDTLDNEYYNFDKVILERLKKLPKKQIREQLGLLAASITQDGNIETIGDFVFPNILQSCVEQHKDHKLSYCAKNKLIIPKAILAEYLDILTDQIKNPFTEKYLFNPLFTTTMIDYFKFTKYPDETIEIEFL